MRIKKASKFLLKRFAFMMILLIRNILNNLFNLALTHLKNSITRLPMKICTYFLPIPYRRTCFDYSNNFTNSLVSIHTE